MPRSSSTPRAKGTATSAPDVHTEIISAISQADSAGWNRLAGSEQPFLRHEFLETLETSRCVGAESGWEPCHVVAYDDSTLVGAMPLYRKSNPWGEFVFDWSWSDAYRQTGLNYYPKLVSAVPFTPAGGSRLLVAPDRDSKELSEVLVSAAIQHAGETDASSLHILFPMSDELPQFESSGLLVRKDCQFHWRNRGYDSFDDFLSTFTAAKRKKAKRDRRRAAENGIRFRRLRGKRNTSV